jgi:hypothetical protein
MNTLTEDQITEFKSLLTSIKEYSTMFPALRDLGSVDDVVEIAGRVTHTRPVRRRLVRASGIRS